MRAALLALALAAAAALGADQRGTYRVGATVQVEGVPLVRELELRADVILRPGAAPGAVQARLAAQGHACELDARLGAGGVLAVPPGQRCVIALDDPGARGRIEATVRSGGGRVSGGRLTLQLELALAGAVWLAPEGVELFGVPLPVGGGREVPIAGRARAVAEGSRDESRAAER